MAKRSGRSGGKILFITLEYLPPHRSGNGVYAEQVVGALTKLGDVTVLTCQHNRNSPDHIVPVYLDKKTTDKGMDFSNKSLRAIEELGGFDLIIGVDWNSALPAMAMKKKEQCPLLWMPFRIHTHGDCSLTIREMEGSIARKADAILTVSKTDALLVERFFHRNAEVIYPPLSIKGDKRTDKKDEYILAVSRVSPEKSIERLIKAMPYVTPELSLIIAGGIDNHRYLDELKALSADLKVDNRVILKGRVDRENLSKLYSGAMIYISPSAYEPYGMSIMEAAYHGLPIVLDNSGMIGAGELLADGRNCIKVNMDDAQDLAQTVNTIFNDPSLASSLGIEAQKAAEKLTIEAFEDKINNFILGMINKG